MGDIVRIKELRDLIEKQDYKCALTGDELEPNTASADHINPVVNGGRNSIRNIQILHQRVNAAKGTMSNDEFIEMCIKVALNVGGCVELSVNNQSAGPSGY